jgi:hypothetical protein
MSKLNFTLASYAWNKDRMTEADDYGSELEIVCLQRKTGERR